MNKIELIFQHFEVFAGENRIKKKNNAQKTNFSNKNSNKMDSKLVNIVKTSNTRYDK